MPERTNGSSGRYEPVRGDVPPLQTQSAHGQDDPQRRFMNASLGGQKAAMPPSPPSTVDEDEGSTAGDLTEQAGRMQVRSQVEEDEELDEIEEEEGQSDDDDDFDDDGAASQASSYAPASVSSSTVHQLTAAATAIASTRGASPPSAAQGKNAGSVQHPHPSTYRSPGSSFSSNASSLQRLTNPRATSIAAAMSRLPDTPLPSATTSPACIASLSHHPTQSAQAFFSTKLFTDFPTSKGSEGLVGVADDAGVDLACPGWEGAVLDQTRLGGGRTLYTLLPPSARAERLREDVLALLDLASEKLGCGVVVIAVDKQGVTDDAERKAVLHGLCYVGGSVVSAHGGKDPISRCTVRRGTALVAVEL
ncbi:hypothetical protein BDZ90DRAFT_233471 [Jaminaea rosea]|uniref:Ornithine decarboxylase antizyme n=1 Tax=Jaminaea rosea TaxID=1569628 RepID=A0A316UM92_9BASI|nr:hypothetical protein BDZ90DRAFT_233471 [Jaminaea rosea]PWN26340.1 hypothetical protein BDZ90DRAFT_233471 [Jaminaea rosea]